MPDKETTAIAGVDASNRGSWSRPIGPRPQPSSAGGSGGVDSGGSGGNGGGGGDGDRGCVSVKSVGRSSNRSQRQVAVLAAERVVGSEAQLPHESIANETDTDVLVRGRSSVEESDNSLAKDRRPVGGSSGDGGASDSSRNLCRSPNEDAGVLHPRKRKVVRTSD